MRWQNVDILIPPDSFADVFKKLHDQQFGFLEVQFLKERQVNTCFFYFPVFKITSSLASFEKVLVTLPPLVINFRTLTNILKVSL